jgi:Sulfatase
MINFFMVMEHPSKQSVNRESLFLFLLPAIFLLHNYNELFGFISLGQVFKYAGLIYGSVLIAYFIFGFFLLPRWKTAMILFIILFWNLFFGPFHGFAKRTPGLQFLSRYVIFLPLAGAVTAWLTWKIARSKHLPQKLISYFNIVTISLLVWEFGNLGLNYLEIRKTNNLIYPDKPLCEQYIPQSLSDSSKPDIFFLVFDEYTNNNSLQKIWNFDNRAITDWLQKKAFYVALQSNANYPCTFFSIPSAFNMNFLDAKKGSDGTVARNMLQGNQSISDNETFCLLRKANYEISFIAPFRNSIQENGLGHFFDFLSNDQLYRQTMIGSLANDISWNFIPKNSEDALKKLVIEKLQAKVESTQKTIAAIKSAIDSTSNRKPHFVYGHLMVPHEPNIFDSTGRFLADKTSFTDSGVFSSYTNQVKYANLIMVDLVSSIRLHNRPNTIIILLGDHGYKESRLDSMIPYSYPNFTAFYFPDKKYENLYETITPVNIFRIVFSQYLGQKIPRIKDSQVAVRQF